MLSTTSTPLSQRVREFLDANQDVKLTSQEIARRMCLSPDEAKAVSCTLRDMAVSGKANRVRVESKTQGGSSWLYFSTHGIDRKDAKSLAIDIAAAALNNPPRGPQQSHSDKGTAYTPNSSLAEKIKQHQPAASPADAQPEVARNTGSSEPETSEGSSSGVAAVAEQPKRDDLPAAACSDVIDGYTADRLAKNGTPEPGADTTNADVVDKTEAHENEVLKAANHGLGERIERMRKSNTELMDRNDSLAKMIADIERQIYDIHGICTEAGIGLGSVVNRVRDLAAMKTLTLARACETQSGDAAFWRGIAGDALKLAQRIAEAAKNGA